MTPCVSLLVATLPRSGSWLLAEGLEGTGRCGHPREYFRSDYQELYARAWKLHAGAGIGEYLRETLSRGTTPNGVFSAKLHWGQLEHLAGQLEGDPRPELLERFFPSPRYVYLTRDDKAGQAVSLFQAVRSDVWWTLDEAEDEPVAPLDEADLAEIERLELVLREHERHWRAFFDGLTELLVVTYRELAEEYEAIVRRVFAFLDLAPPAAVPPPGLKKQAGRASQAYLGDYLRYREGRASCGSRPA